MLAIEIAKLLDAEGLASYSEADDSGDIFIDWMPDAPELAVSVMSQPGDIPDPKLGYDRPGFQVIVRGSSDPLTGHQRARDIFAALHGLRNLELPDGTWLVGCSAQQSDPVPMGADPNGRMEYSLNFLCEVRALTANRE